VELSFRQGHLYLRAYDLDRRGWREFRTDRIGPGSLEVLPERLPPGRPASRRYRLRYRLSAALAGAGVSERFPGQQVEALPDGGVEVSAEIESLFWAETTLLKYGAEVEVLEPGRLRAAMAETARRLARIYRTE
jgi:predicted DNA-binding transcriptional regulator YafY